MEQPVEHVRLSEYLDRVQKAIKAALPDSCWVVAELASIKNSPKGHVYLDLVDSEAGREVAKVRAMMFSHVAKSVYAKWIEATGGKPQDGMRLLMKVRSVFSVQYGYSLQVTAIDPAYTLGDMQMQVQKVIANLQQKGLYDLQRRFQTPSSFWRVAVISPHEAAGLADFRRDADRLDQAGVCQFEYFSAVFQGKDSSESIRAAMKTAHERHQAAPFDVLCIIRGGGSKSDLAWLNDGVLAAWACRFPIPVFSGIGHEIDETVLDLVAHRRFDTPSKVIGFFRGILQEEAANIRLTQERIANGLLRLVSSEKSRLEQALPRLKERCRVILSQEERRVVSAGNAFDAARARLLSLQAARIKQLEADYMRRAHYFCSKARLEVGMSASRFSAGANALIQRERSRLELTGTLYDKTNPMALLTKGFALVRDPSGRLVTSASAAQAAEALHLSFADGVVEAQPKPSALATAS